jgi:hypothetical protein
MVCVALNLAGNLVPFANWILKEIVGCEESISGCGKEEDDDAAGAGASTGAATLLPEALGVGLPNL